MTIAKMTIWSLFDGSGLMIERAAEMGHKCYCFNYSEADHGSYLDYRIYGRLGGKSARTKLIRSRTPRGFAIAVNKENLK